MPTSDPERRREQQRAASARYQARHPERVKEMYAKYRENNKEKHIEATRRWRANNRQRYLWGKFEARLRPYGIDGEDWARIFNTQERKCAGCFEHLDGGKHTHLDHCHTTGRVRGLLCTLCNSALGYARDRITTLHNLIYYLERSRV